MKSIKKIITNEQIINKSKFINYLIPVKSVDETIDHLAIIGQEHPNASHFCSAYIIGNNQEIQKVNDDGEPSKTAGYPMIEVLKKHDLTNVYSVTVRYFGGIKLGAGGLVRAYSKSVAESILLADFSSLVPYSNITLTISFDLIGVIEKFVRDNYILLETKYDSKVNYFIKIKNCDFDEFVNKVSDYTKGNYVIEKLKEYDEYE